MKLELSLSFLSIAGILFGVFMWIVGLIVFKNEDKKLKGSYMMLLPGFNVGLFAYPVVEAIWGADGVKYFGMFDMGNSIPIFAICYIIASYFSGKSKIGALKIGKKLLTSIPLMSYIVTLIVNLSGFHYPAVIINITGILGKANMPLSLLLLGICLNFTLDKCYRKGILKVIFIRYSIGLAVGLFLFFTVPFGKLFRYTLLMAFILPIGMADIPYAVEFGYDKRLIGTACNLTIMLSFVFIWVIASSF